MMSSPRSWFVALLCCFASTLLVVTAQQDASVNIFNQMHQCKAFLTLSDAQPKRDNMISEAEFLDFCNRYKRIMFPGNKPFHQLPVGLEALFLKVAPGGELDIRGIKSGQESQMTPDEEEFIESVCTQTVEEITKAMSVVAIDADVSGIGFQTQSLMEEGGGGSGESGGAAAGGGCEVNVNVDIQIKFPDEEFAACDDEAQENSFLEAIVKAMEEGSAAWDTKFTFEPLQLDMDQEQNFVDPFGDIRTRNLRILDSDYAYTHTTSQQSRALENVCPDRASAKIVCDNKNADYCRWGCLKAKSDNCDGFTKGQFADVEDEINKSLRDLAKSGPIDCLGLSDKLQVMISADNPVAVEGGAGGAEGGAAEGGGSGAEGEDGATRGNSGDNTTNTSAGPGAEGGEGAGSPGEGSPGEGSGAAGGGGGANGTSAGEGGPSSGEPEPSSGGGLGPSPSGNGTATGGTPAGEEDKPPEAGPSSSGNGTDTPSGPSGEGGTGEVSGPPGGETPPGNGTTSAESGPSPNGDGQEPEAGSGGNMTDGDLLAAELGDLANSTAEIDVDDTEDEEPAQPILFNASAKDSNATFETDPDTNATDTNATDIEVDVDDTEEERNANNTTANATANLTTPEPDSEVPLPANASNANQTEAAPEPQLETPIDANATGPIDANATNSNQTNIMPEPEGFLNQTAPTNETTPTAPADVVAPTASNTTNATIDTGDQLPSLPPANETAPSVTPASNSSTSRTITVTSAFIVSTDKPMTDDMVKTMNLAFGDFISG